MTMTLGFDAFGYFEALFDERVAREIFAALAKHAPVQPLRIARYGSGGYSVSEIGTDGVERQCDEAAAISAAIADASFVDWPNTEAPLGVEPILLPGSGWDLAALSAEPIIKSEDVAYYFAAGEAGAARIMLDARCDALLDVAEAHRLVLVFR